MWGVLALAGDLGAVRLFDEQHLAPKCLCV